MVVDVTWEVNNNVAGLECRAAGKGAGKANAGTLMGRPATHMHNA